ncbi:MAG: hypothetical protein MMC23_002587 [Stictis urceolatum]|nr:hypothetical protein [Stictis urceolata]
MEQAPRYEKLSTISEEDDIFRDQEALLSRARPIHNATLTTPWLWLVHIILFTISGLLIFCNGFAFHPTTQQHVEKFSSYSPAAPAVSYSSIKFNGSTGDMSPYVGASPESDAAWNRITFDIGDQMISESELVAIDKPNTVLKVTDPNTGIEGYRIGLEVFHQLHCLNLLRKVSYQEYYRPMGGDFADPPEKFRGHVDHCIEMLRMNLMCESDIGVITFHEVPGMDDGPWPDFSTWHTCRNFEAVRDWAVEHTVSNDDVF